MAIYPYAGRGRIQYPKSPAYISGFADLIGAISQGIDAYKARERQERLDRERINLQQAQFEFDKKQYEDEQKRLDELVPVVTGIGVEPGAPTREDYGQFGHAMPTRRMIPRRDWEMRGKPMQEFAQERYLTDIGRQIRESERAEDRAHDIMIEKMRTKRALDVAGFRGGEGGMGVPSRTFNQFAQAALDARNQLVQAERTEDEALMDEADRAYTAAIQMLENQIPDYEDIRTLSDLVANPSTPLEEATNAFQQLQFMSDITPEAQAYIRTFVRPYLTQKEQAATAETDDTETFIERTFLPAEREVGEAVSQYLARLGLMMPGSPAQVGITRRYFLGEEEERERMREALDRIMRGEF